MNKTNLTDTLTYVTGLGAGYTGITTIPGVSDPMTQGNFLTALVGLITLILQFLIIKWNRSNDAKREARTTDINDLQRQITELKIQQHVKQHDLVDQ